MEKSISKRTILDFFKDDENLTIERHLAWFKNNRKNVLIICLLTD